MLALSGDPLTQLSQTAWQDFGTVEAESAQASHSEHVNTLLNEVQRTEYEVNDSLGTEHGTFAFSTPNTCAALADDSDTVVIFSRRERGQLASLNSSHPDILDEEHTSRRVKRPRLFEPNSLAEVTVQKRSNASATAAAVSSGQLANQGAHANMASNVTYNAQELHDEEAIGIDFPADPFMRSIASPGELKLRFSPQMLSPSRPSFNGDTPSEGSLLSTFFPLSFNETQPNMLLPNAPTTRPTQHAYLVDISDNAIRSQHQVFEQFPSPRNSDTPAFSNKYPSGPAITSPRRSLCEFLDLRSRTHLTWKAMPRALTPASPNQRAQPRPTVGDIIPEPRAPSEVYDDRTIVLPMNGHVQLYDHRYLASLGIITKSAFTRSLASPRALVSLVERDSLDGADIVVDPHAALLIVSLFGISSSVQALTLRLVRLCDRFDNILVAFEAYLPARALRSEGDRGHCSTTHTHAPNVFSPAALKAIHKLRRDLAIAEGCRQKRPGSTVFYAFAHTVDEAAQFVRIFGNYAQQLDRSGGLLWGRRQWLTDEEDEVSKLFPGELCHNFSLG